MVFTWQSRAAKIVVTGKLPDGLNDFANVTANKVWSLTQFYSDDFTQSRISAK